MLRLLQWSDSHLNASGVSAMQRLIPTVPDIDLCIHCGDVTQGHYQDGIGNYDATKSVCVIGNHDSIDERGVNPVAYEWHKQVSQKTLFDTYLAKSKTALELDIADNTTWWSKLVASENVLILGVNDTALGDAQSSQIAWFKNKVKYAEDNSLSLVVVKHGPTNYVNLESNSFTSKYMDSASFISDKVSYVNTYKGNDAMITELVKTNAKVLCVLCGHEHGDGFGYIVKNDSTNIPVVFVGSTFVDGYNDVARTTNESLTTCVVANVVEYDSNVDTLRVYRLGADGIANGGARKILSHSYGKNGIVSICSVR